MTSNQKDYEPISAANSVAVVCGNLHYELLVESAFAEATADKSWAISAKIRSESI